jgi:hypothetical protein
VLAAGGGLAIAATLLSGAVAEAASASPPTVTVTSLKDTPHPSPSHVHHHRAPTLADAIKYLDSKNGGTIRFASKLSGTIDLTSQLPHIDQPMRIEGPGPARLTITAAHVKRPYTVVLDVYVHRHIAAEISGLTITGGTDSGIYSQSALTVDDCTITGNAASTAGGGIEDLGGPLVVEHSRITHNTAEGFGGGGLFFGSKDDLTVLDSTISANDSGDGGDGGGIYTSGYGRTLIDGSTISGNTASYDDAGIKAIGYPAEGYGADYSPPKGPDLFIENSTIADNTADGNGNGRYIGGNAGGIYIGNDGAGGKTSLTVVGSTISGNIAKRGLGGGIQINYATLKLDDTIIAGNTAATKDQDVYLSTESGPARASFSLIGDGTTVGASPLITNSTDIIGTDAKPENPALAKLGWHGGPTKTMPPMAGSPALGRGNARHFTKTTLGFRFDIDQRHIARFGVGGSSQHGDGTDIGAVEVTKTGQTKSFAKGDKRVSVTTPLASTMLSPAGSVPIVLNSQTLRNESPQLRFKHALVSIAGSSQTVHAKYPSDNLTLSLKGLKHGKHTLKATITLTEKLHGHTKTITKTLRFTIDVS